MQLARFIRVSGTSGQTRTVFIINSLRWFIQYTLLNCIQKWAINPAYLHWILTRKQCGRGPNLLTLAGSIIFAIPGSNLNAIQQPHRFQNTFGWSEKEVIKASKDPSKGVINAAALRESYFKDAHNRGLMSGYVSSYRYHKEMMS